MPQRGYTLIEILVGLTIIGLIFGFGFVNFRDFSRRQALFGAGRILTGDLRLAQQSALSGTKPSGANCNSPNLLDGYAFRVVSSTRYVIEAECSGGTIEVKSVEVTPDVSITAPSPNPILFKSIGQGTNIPEGDSSEIILSQIQTLNTVTVTVSDGGEIK